MNFKSRKCEENGKKVLRYSIRKHHLGVASVAVASVLFFATGVVTVQADGAVSGEPVSGTPAPPSTPGSASTTSTTSTTSTLGTSGANTGDAEIENTNIDTDTAASTESNGNNRAALTENGPIKPEDNVEVRNNNEKPRGLERATEPANYDGKVSLIGQWTSESHEKKDTENTYKNAIDKLGSPLSNPGLFRGAAKTFLGWSDMPPVNGKIADGARLFSAEDTIATAFPNGLSADSKLYGVYASLNDQDTPFPADKFSMGFAIIGGMNKFAINDNKVHIDTNVESEEVLPNTNLNKEIKDKEKNTRRIIDEYKPDNNDTTKVNEVVLKAEFEMDKTTAMTVYRNPHVGYVGPVLSNTYKDNNFKLDEKKKTYTYVDLNVNLDKDLVVPEKLYAEFNGYSWRPLYALGIKEDGTKEILNVYSKEGTALGNTKDSFNSIVSNTDPRVTFGVETKGNHNITFRMILRSLNGYDSNRPENERNESIAESVVKPDEGKSIAETILRNMTLRSLTSTELKALFPNKSDEEINQMVVRINQDKAKELADTNGNTVLKVTGSVEGNVHPSAGRIGSGWLSLDSATNLPINKVEANVLELGYVTFYNVSYRFQSGTEGKVLPAVIPADKAVKKSNPTATDVKVGKDGTTAVIPANKADDKSKDADGVKDPSVTQVTDPSNLTDAEKAKVAEAVKKSNPTATDVKVGKDGTTTVTFPDGSTAVIPADKAVTSAEQGSHAVAPADKAVTSAEQGSHAATPAKKAGAKELPNTGTADSTVAMVAAAASALLGLGLAGRRRKEDEEA